MKAQQINQTPKKEPLINKKLRRVTVRKSLDHAFVSPLGDDVAIEVPNDSLQHHQNHEISKNLIDQFDESFLASDLTAISSNETVDLSPLTSSCSSTVTKHVIGNNSTEKHQSFEPDNSSDKAGIDSVEVVILVKHLKKAQIQVTNSTDTDLLSKKLVSKLIDVVVEDFICPIDKSDRFESILAMKFGALVMGFLLVLPSVVVMYFFYEEKSSYKSPLPT